MIPKEVTDALLSLWASAAGIQKDDKTAYHHDVIRNFLATTDRYVRELEQHVDDLVAGQHGMNNE